MNTLLSLSDAENLALQEWHAERLLHCPEDQYHRERIEQLERARESSHQLYDFEGGA